MKIIKTNHKKLKNFDKNLNNSEKQNKDKIMSLITK